MRNFIRHIFKHPNLYNEFRAGSVSEKIIDESPNEPLAYVNIVIKEAANKAVIIIDDVTFNIPSVNIDQQTGNIRHNGNENLRVLESGYLITYINIDG